MARDDLLTKQPPRRGPIVAFLSIISVGWPAAGVMAGDITLPARDAVLHGDGATFQVWTHRRCIGDWRDSNTWASWDVEFASSGRVTVEIDAAAGDQAAGGEFELRIGAAKLKGRVTSTGGSSTFKTMRVGEIELPAAGRQPVEFRPVRIAGSEGLLNLRAVILRGEGLQARLRKWGESAPPGKSEMIGDVVARFRPAEFNPNEAGPSFALQYEPKVRGAAPDHWRVRPSFGCCQTVYAYWKGSPAYRGAKQLWTAHVMTAPGDSLYGTGEIAGRLLRNGHVSVCWNTDAFGYDDGSISLYQSHPWVLAVRADGSSYGVLADTTWQCEIDLTDGVRFSTDGPPFAVIVIEGKMPQDVVMRLADLTGKIPLPPRWALGYQQCRFSYFPEQRVREIAAGFRERHIPCDVIWFDIDYMDGFRIFTFDKSHFPDPKRLNDALHQQGFKTVWMIDPGVKVDPKYAVYRQGAAGDHWIKAAVGGEYHGRVWPGECAFPDYTRPETREWWADLYRPFMAVGIDGIWNDMNEPAVFYRDKPTGTMPPDNLHRGGAGLPPGPHAQYHNAYGMLMSRATREGIASANPSKRPFVLTRASYLGGQRYAATWTGDNQANWDHLGWSIPMLLNLGMSGQPFCGPDIGGFEGDGDGEMFARWMGIGALFPFSRGHSTKGSRNKEPWAFGEPVERTCRIALQRRYRLLPYLYTLFHEAAETGLPVMRPLFFADPADAKLRAIDDAFLLGSDLLVQANVQPAAKRDQAAGILPRGIWRELTLIGDEEHQDSNLPPLYVRGGAIIPIGRVIENTTENSLDPLTLIVCLDERGAARGRLYEDAGDGHDYRNDQYLLTEYVAQQRGDAVIVKAASFKGNFARPSRAVHVELITSTGIRRALGAETSEIEIPLR